LPSSDRYQPTEIFDERGKMEERKTMEERGTIEEYSTISPTRTAWAKELGRSDSIAYY